MHSVQATLGLSLLPLLYLLVAIPALDLLLGKDLRANTQVRCAAGQSGRTAARACSKAKQDVILMT